MALQTLRQRTVVRTEPSRRASAIVGAAITVLACAALLWMRPNGEQLWRAADPLQAPNGTPQQQADQAQQILLVAVLFCCLVMWLGLASALVNGRRWLLHRTIVRMARTSLAPQTLWEPAPVRAAVVPELVIDKARRVRLRRPRRVDSRHNVAGQPPLRLAYLRVFDNQPRARTFLEGAWRELGYVYMLRGASSVTPRELRELRRTRRSELFVSSPAELRHRLQRATTSPEPRGRRVFRDLAPTTIRTRDRYGAYPPVAVLCHGSFWQEAVDEILLRVDAVCMDLSGFTRKNQGAGYELQRVVDRFPIERVLFLMDNHGDQKFLRAAIRRAWHQMAAGSPNAGRELRRTHLAKTDRYHTVIQTNAQGAETGRQPRLVAVRSQTRGLGVWFQGVVAAARPPSRTRDVRGAGTGADVDRASPVVPRVPRREPWGLFAALLLMAVAVVGTASAADLLGEPIDSQTFQDRRESPGPSPPDSTQPPPEPTEPTGPEPPDPEPPDSEPPDPEPPDSEPPDSEPPDSEPPDPEPPDSEPPDPETPDSESPTP